jgi:hypothetical protein
MAVVSTTFVGVLVWSYYIKSPCALCSNGTPEFRRVPENEPTTATKGKNSQLDEQATITLR